MKYLIVFILLIWSNLCSAQNLVPDSSFEEILHCPRSFNHGYFKKLTRKWLSPTFATADYFHECSKGNVGVPKNYFGIQSAHTGKGYVGFYVLYYFDEYKEYLEVELLTGLAKDSLYCIKLFISRPTFIYYSTDKLGVLLTKNRIIRFNDAVITHKNRVNFDSSKVFSVSTEWTCLNLIYRAKGGERFLTIGSFDSDNKTRFEVNPLPNKFKSRYLKNRDNSYFYMDDVSLTLVGKALDCSCNKIDSASRIKVNQLENKEEEFLSRSEPIIDSIILNCFTFQIASWKLNDTSKVMLRKVVERLEEDSSLFVSIEGHTDNIGREEDNQLLSEKRAEEVYDFLIKEGIKKERLSYLGFGSSNPLRQGNSELERRENRRVELKFYRKSSE